MGYREVMDLPMRVFWELSGQVDRLRADEGALAFRIACSAQTPDAAESMGKWFDKVAPGPFKLRIDAVNSEPEQGGIDELRNLAMLG